MESLVVDPINPLPVISKIVQILHQESAYNNWTSVCLNFLLASQRIHLVNLITLISTLTPVPILICSQYGCCPSDETFAVNYGNSGITVRLNSTFGLMYHPVSPCHETGCVEWEERIINGEKDPLRIFLSDGLNIWKKEIYYPGQLGAITRLFKDKFPASIEYTVRRGERVPEVEVKEEVFKCLTPFKLENPKLGTSK